MPSHWIRNDIPKSLTPWLRATLHQGNRIAIAGLTGIGLALDGDQYADVFLARA